MKVVVLCLVALAVSASAAPKQIIIAPPPPPTPPSSVGPGLEFGFVIPGYTNTTFGTTQINTLCSALRNFTTGYPSSAISCNLTPAGVNPYPGNYVMVTGFLAWQNFVGMTDQDKLNAIASRDQAEYYLQNNAVGALNTTFPGIAIDCSCNPYYARADGGAETNTIPGIPLAQCTIQAKFASATDTLFSVGIDNGKICPTGAPYIIPSNVATALSLAAGGGGTAYGAIGSTILSCTADTTTAYTCTLNSNTPLQYMQVGQHIDITIADVDQTGTPCTAAEDTAILDKLNSEVFPISGVPASSTGQTFIRFKTTFNCNSGSAFTIKSNAASVVNLTGRWSPLCDSSFAFYEANNPLSNAGNSNTPSIGSTCPACTTTAGRATLFAYTGPNKGKYCSKFTLAGGVAATSRTADATLALGTSCIAVGVNGGSMATTGGKPTLQTPTPSGLTLADIFPGISSSFVEYNVNTTKGVAIDSQMLMPCSDPPLSKAPAPGGMAGVPDQATCNTASFFNNGGTGTASGGNGIPFDSDACLVLTTTVSGPLAGTSPSPAPSPSPKAPTPSLSPPPSPIAPSPPATLKCVYSGSYTIQPNAGPCSSVYIAWASPSNCSATTVNLRKESDLGGKPQRALWRLSTSADGPKGVPSNIVAPKATCANRNLAGVLSSSGALRLAGASFRWQIVPASKSNCNVVNMIAQNRLSTTAFLNVAKKSDSTCSNKFNWVSANGGRAQFKLTKA